MRSRCHETGVPTYRYLVVAAAGGLLCACGPRAGPPARFHPTSQPAEEVKPQPSPSGDSLFLTEKEWSKEQDPALRDLPDAKGREFDPDRLPRDPEVRPDQVAILQILIRHKEVTGAPRHPRDKQAARRRALYLTRLARLRGVDFSDLAKKYSEEPPDVRGAFHLVKPGSTAASLERVAFSVGFGQVANPVDTYRGIYVIMPVQIEYSTAHILVQHRKSQAKLLGVERTREEAKKRAEIARRAVLQPGASFAEIAKRFSDSPTKDRGGIRRPMFLGREPPEFEAYLDAVAKLKDGQISPIIETPFGFHVIKRLALEKIRARHILISYTGSYGRPAEPRTRLQALKIALDVHRKLKGKPVSFKDFAKRHSDCPSKRKGGDLGLFARGVMPYPFEQAVFAMQPGEISEVIETRLGFHIIERLK